MGKTKLWRPRREGRRRRLVPQILRNYYKLEMFPLAPATGVPIIANEVSFQRHYSR